MISTLTIGQTSPINLSWPGPATPNHENRDAFVNVIAVTDTKMGDQDREIIVGGLNPDYKPDLADVLELRIGASSPWKNV